MVCRLYPFEVAHVFWLLTFSQKPRKRVLSTLCWSLSWGQPFSEDGMWDDSGNPERDPIHDSYRFETHLVLNVKDLFSALRWSEDQLSQWKKQKQSSTTKYNGKVLDAGTGNKIKIMQAKDQVKMKLVLSWKEFAELRLTWALLFQSGGAQGTVNKPWSALHSGKTNWKLPLLRENQMIFSIDTDKTLDGILCPIHN